MIDPSKYNITDFSYTESYTPSFEGKITCSYVTEEELEEFIKVVKEFYQLDNLVYSHNTGTRAIRVFKDKN